MLRVTIKSGDKYYFAYVSRDWAVKNDNGALISCGLTVGRDIRQTQLDWFIRHGRAGEITFDEWNHSSCQSECIKHGGKTCRW